MSEVKQNNLSFLSIPFNLKIVHEIINNQNKNG